ncbi:hypothetical protein QNI16_18395 [Cytophagaceae bacterium YF14B1]|uniref:Uncharacterized protein n=1 Tax=Xanthocytophaga flava TaxID=3048013 RepID=A0AAE3QS34_9BACT|nr:hypothetical protein [Xanthocytophaga flavus]MDJ1482480.1 hypothetical protein [Xanthocytophaga flavus]
MKNSKLISSKLRLPYQLVWIFLLLCNSSFRNKEYISKGIDEDNYIFSGQIGFKVINPSDNDILSLKKRFRETRSLNILLSGKDKFCLLSIKNNSANDIYFISIDSCLASSMYMIYGQYIGKYIAKDSVMYTGRKRIIDQISPHYDEQMMYRIKSNTTTQLYLPYPAEGVDSMSVELSLSIPKKHAKIADPLSYNKCVKEYKKFHLSDLKLWFETNQHSNLELTEVFERKY